MPRIDLHAHSRASDGTSTPAEVVRRAADAGLDVVALTDHDTTAGWATAAAALPAGLALVRGAELSCRWSDDDSSVEMHLLAYLFDPGEPVLAGQMALLTDDRVRRAQVMVERLRALGADISWEQVETLAAGGSVGRPHVARALVDAGVVPDVPAAFSPAWIGAGGRALVDKHSLDPVQAIGLVRAAGGVTVAAHVGAVSRGRTLPERAVRELAAAGLTGLEVDHPDHDPVTRKRLRALAGELSLVVTGSSDDHGDLTGHRLGANLTAAEEYDALVAGASGVPVTR